MEYRPFNAVGRTAEIVSYVAVDDVRQSGTTTAAGNVGAEQVSVRPNNFVSNKDGIRALIDTRDIDVNQENDEQGEPYKDEAH